MPIKNEAMLITYSDSMGKNIKETHEVLKNYIGDAIGGVHLLPFFPSTGDRGFAPYRYDVVDSAFGNWDDVEALGEDYYLMFDFMINHISKKSEMYQDFKKKHDDSKYNDFFIRWEKFWEKADVLPDSILTQSTAQAAGVLSFLRERGIHRAGLQGRGRA